MTAFGWLAGGTAGFVLNLLVARFVGPDRYPVAPTTFVLFLAGAFGGMTLADRLGVKAFRPFAMAAGIAFAVLLSIFVIAFVLSDSTS